MMAEDGCGEDKENVLLTHVSFGGGSVRVCGGISFHFRDPLHVFRRERQRDRREIYWLQSDLSLSLVTDLFTADKSLLDTLFKLD